VQQRYEALLLFYFDPAGKVQMPNLQGSEERIGVAYAVSNEQGIVTKDSARRGD
jgi:hypothetical protein